MGEERGTDDRDDRTAGRPRRSVGSAGTVPSRRANDRRGPEPGPTARETKPGPTARETKPGPT
ncbi:hypothetical protein ABZU25_34195, partial [Micromonospora sp. NPDC005215]|uniref:hypothetical protein n=1 Tax=Micromonospora sp. NPDC005215 TaxID=3157024 RepID=UPI00339DEEE0